VTLKQRHVQKISGLHAEKLIESFGDKLATLL
jgi:hypothetical protein